MTNKEAIQWLEAIDKKYIHGGDEWYDAQRHKAINIAIKALESRPQGEWIIDGQHYNYYANCSCCGYQMDTHEEHGYFKFCPNCEAKMTKEAENENY